MTTACPSVMIILWLLPGRGVTSLNQFPYRTAKTGTGVLALNITNRCTRRGRPFRRVRLPHISSHTPDRPSARVSSIVIPNIALKRKMPPQANRSLRIICYAIAWASITASTVAIVNLLIWYAITPAGFWKIPRIYSATIPPKEEPSIPEGIKLNYKYVKGEKEDTYYRIHQSEISNNTIGQKILIMDCMYSADNQPRVYKVTLFRLFIGYPWITFAFGLFIHIFLRKTRCKPTSPPIIEKASNDQASKSV